MASIIKMKKIADINHQNQMKETQPKIFHLNIIEKYKQMIEQKKVEILSTERIYIYTIILLAEITEKIINMVQMN